MFMSINQNQKAVSATLRITLEEDLYWGSDLAASRIKALRSSVIQRLADDQGPLFSKISIGEDKAFLSATPFYNALTKATLLPKVKGNQYDEDLSRYSLYNIHKQDHASEMPKVRGRLVAFLNLCYEYAESNFFDVFEQEQGFLLLNRGTFAFISLIGSLNEFETDSETIASETKPEDRFNAIEKYLKVLLEGIQNLSDGEVEELKGKLGSGADIKWFRRFQLLVNERYPVYEPSDLVD
ncbi:MAG: hypothetical protein COB36_03375 [Alphaproteobacteria bacterium]|nr:MAG: hypothetical protein COB36_03375 [Alphaproteobacteria bacterium]